MCLRRTTVYCLLREGPCCYAKFVSPASVANSSLFAHQGITTWVSPRLRYEFGRSLEQSPVWILFSFISTRPASVRVELGGLAGTEHFQIQQHIGCHSRRSPLASNQEKDQLQDHPYGLTLHGRGCTGVSDGTVPSSRLLVVTSLFGDFGVRHLAIGPLLSQALKLGTLFRSRLDNLVTIYCFSKRNWKRIYFSSCLLHLQENWQKLYFCMWTVSITRLSA